MDNIGDILSSLSKEDIENLQNTAREIFKDADFESEREKENSQGANGAFDFLNPDVILKISELMGQMNKEDSRCELINALKPHLSEFRQKKADEAMQLIRMLDILPLIERFK